MNFDHLPLFLRPRLRLFLSADLVGSTGLKQGTVGSIIASDTSKASVDYRPRWIDVITDFYRSFEIEFSKSWQTYGAVISRKIDWPTGPQPEIWKINGDELIYVKELDNSRECYAVISCWLAALHSYRAKLRAASLKLDVKATAWIAGFPLVNSEVVFYGDPSKRLPSADVGLSIVHHFDLLQEWYSRKRTSHELFRDFIGPSIDTGFRLADLSSPRKFMISVDLAYILSLVDADDDIEPSIGIRYDGKAVLKGVLGGQAYPLFWIDASGQDALTKCEDDLTGSKHLNLRYIKSYCKGFFAANPDFLFVPFIARDKEQSLSKVPQNYGTALDLMHEKWLSEKAKLRFERKESAPSGGQSEVRADPKEIEKVFGNLFSILDKLKVAKPTKKRTKPPGRKAARSSGNARQPRARRK